MNEEKKSQLYKNLKGLKGMILESYQEQRGCHFNVGISLSNLREQIIDQLEEHDKEMAAKTIPPLIFEIPSKKDSGVWTVMPSEAYRLYCQLESLVTPDTTPEKTITQIGHAKVGGEQSNNRVFLVHGHDDAARESVARFLEKLKMTPIILHEQANAGNTVIEKLEQNADVVFAVVLLTPDDEGRKTGTDQIKQRARQNVVLELGYFLGSLGRRNVCALYSGDIEIPSDYLGVIFVQFDTNGGWRLQLAKEMKAAGLDVDMNRAL